MMRHFLWYNKEATSDATPWLVQEDRDGSEPQAVSEAFFRNATVITSFVPEGHVNRLGGPRGILIVETYDDGR